MRAVEILENHSPVIDLMMKLRKGMAASLNAAKLAQVFEVLNEDGHGWTITKNKSYHLSDGGWVLGEIADGDAKRFYRYGASKNTGRIYCETDVPRSLAEYPDTWGEDRQASMRVEAQRKYDELKQMGTDLEKMSHGPEKGKWYVRNVQMEEAPHPTYGEKLRTLDVSFELYVLTSGFIITSPDGQAYEVFGDHKNGAIGATTFASWFAWAVENTEIMDQILAALNMEAHEKKHDAKERYTPPAGAPAEEKRIFAMLKEMTQQARDSQKEQLISGTKRDIMNFMDAVAEQDQQKMRRYIEKNFTGFAINRCYDIRKKELFADWEAIVEKIAENAVEEMQNVFVYKNTRKLASIASAKKNMLDPKVISISTGGGVLTATIRFSFEDGSNFRVDQSVVLSRSVHNTPFYRFPTTFHNVTLPDGSKMSQPSEERMNEIFAKA